VEHGTFYEDSIQPMFSKTKARFFDSYWNWVRQDGVLLCNAILQGRLTAIDREVVSNCVPVINRADQNLVNHMLYEMMRCQMTQGRGKEYQLVWELGQPLLAACRNGALEPPVFWNLHTPTAPRTTILPDGAIEYTEVQRPGVRNLRDFVAEMRASMQRSGEQGFLKLKKQLPNGTGWTYSADDTTDYFAAMESQSVGSVTFEKKDALVIGAGAGSIGIELVTSLLCGGAR
jgi:fatty acid synthase subunit alpha